MSVEHEIEIFDPPKRMRHPSGKNGETKAPLYADWSIEAREGGKTTLRLVHSGFSAGADWDDEFESHARGWKLMLQNLRQYFARHAHEPAVHLPFMSSVESPRGSIWQTLLGKLGVSAPPKVGDQFRFTTPKGDVLTGVVDLVTDTRDLALVVREYDDALLRFTIEGQGGCAIHVRVWLRDRVRRGTRARERAPRSGQQRRPAEPSGPGERERPRSPRYRCSCLPRFERCTSRHRQQLTR